MKQISPSSSEWLNSANLRHPKLDTALLTRALLFVESRTEIPKPPFADTVLEQGILMADELLPLQCDSSLLAAALIYPAVYYAKIKSELIQETLGEPIYKILSNVKRMDAIRELDSFSRHAVNTKKVDNIRKMLLAIVDDVRIVLIKLSEHLTVLKYLRHQDTTQRRQIATQTLHIYAALANRLGIGQFKWQLEDLAFRYSHPEAYMAISKALKMRRNDREQYTNSMIKKLTTLFKKHRIKGVSITGRAKHIYSIHRKMQKKELDFQQLYDTIAFRILVHSLENCYQALSIVHEEWEPIPEEFDDYIAKPKPNGYQSIHTAVIASDNLNVEIQIRTYAMHDAAELGVAAHWKYKEGDTNENLYEEKINRLRKIMDWQSELNASELFSDRVYVFTPNGDIFDLPQGATPLDFAYRVHTDLGHRCRGVKINGALKPLTYRLQTGDRLEILTAKDHSPSRDWLNPTQGYLHTAHARSKVRHWFRRENYEHNRSEGERIWDKACRKEAFNKSDIQKIYERFNFKQSDDLLAAIGNGDIGVATLTHYLRQITDNQTHETDTTSDIIAPKKETPSNLTIAGVGNLMTQMAKCCKPIPGDPILGYITKNRGISIHHQRCRNIQQAVTYRPQRIIEVSWETQKEQVYPVDLMIDAEDSPSLIRDITTILANQHLPVTGLTSRVDKIKNHAHIHLTIEIKNLDLLQNVLSTLRNIPSIFSVKRY